MTSHTLAYELQPAAMPDSVMSFEGRTHRREAA